MSEYKNKTMINPYVYFVYMHAFITVSVPFHLPILVHDLSFITK